MPDITLSTSVIVIQLQISLQNLSRKSLYEACKAHEDSFAKAGVRVKGDYRENYSPGWKFNHWELKGVPIRMEVGPRDVKNNQVVLVRRDNGQKITEKSDGLVKRIEVQSLML